MKSITLMLALMLLWSCDDIFEQDIEQARIEVIAPAAVSTREVSRTDGDTLRLDYPDPFLRTVAAKPSAPAPVSVAPTARPGVKKERPAVQLACTGRIRKQGTDHYLVSIDGRVHLLRQGESADGFTLRQLRGDSLLMLRDGHSYFVKIP